MLHFHQSSVFAIEAFQFKFQTVDQIENWKRIQKWGTQTPLTHTHTHILYGQKYTHRNTPNSIPPLFDTKLQYYLADSRRTSAPLLSYNHPPPPRGRRISSIRNDWIRKFSRSGKYWDDQPSQRTSFKASFWKDAERGCFWPEADKLRSTFLLPRWNTMLTEENWSEPFSCMFQHTHLTHTHTFAFTHVYVLTPKGCHSHIFKKSLVPHLNKHFLGPWSNNYGNNIQRPAMTGIISALFINKVICEVLPTGGKKNMLTSSNGIWPNGNDILTAAICNAGAPMSCQWVMQYWGNTMKSLIVPTVDI